MRALRLAAAAVIGFGLASSAIANVILSPSSTLDPSNSLFPASGGYTEQACPSPQLCPSNGASINGNQLIDFSIANVDGIGNISLLPNVTGSTSGFFTFSYVLTDLTTSTVVSTGGPPQLPPDFLVFAGHNYEINMNWTLTANVGASISSANWGVNVTTGPNLQTPEPASLLLIGSGLLGLAVSRRRKS